jgi:hypothetical protein
MSNSLISEQSYYLSKKIYLSKNTIILSNIPENLFSKDILYQKKFLGQYGHINKMVLSKNSQNEKKIIVQFDTVNQAALAILSLHNFKIENIKLKVNYFIIKYCLYYLNNKECSNPNCVFLHEKKINNYLLLELKNNKIIDCFKFALDILNLTKKTFDIIYLKLIGDDYYEIQKKFPKLSMKKLKNEDFIKSLYHHYEKEQNINKKNKKKNISNRNSFDSLESNTENLLSSSDESIEKINDSIQKYQYENIFKRKNNSRFDFVNKNNDKLNCNIPDFVLDFLDKYFTLHYININNFQNNDKDKIIIKDFNFNWCKLIN